MANSLKNQRFQPGSIGPGPAAYTLPTSVGYNYEGTPPKKIDRQIPQMYSFGIRPGMRYNTIGPGPVPSGAASKAGQYEEVVTRHGKPASYKYSFGHRIHLRGRDRKPGPADCQPDQGKMKKEEYEKIERLLIRTGPKYSFGARHSELRKDRGPAPNTYFTPDKDTRLMPNVLDVYKTKAPRFIMNSRPNQRISRASPGAAAYHPYMVDAGKGKIVDRVDPIRPRAAEYTMRIRPGTNARTIGPGPNFYDIRPVKGIKQKTNLQPIAVDGKRSPAWVFGQRSGRAPMIIPGDNC